jgi:hypothetical protein
MYNERIAFEHYRIHVMELWPDGPRKEAGLASARYSLERLALTMPKGASFTCTTCGSRRPSVTVIPCLPQVDELPLDLAA